MQGVVEIDREGIAWICRCEVIQKPLVVSLGLSEIIKVDDWFAKCIDGLEKVSPHLPVLWLAEQRIENVSPDECENFHIMSLDPTLDHLLHKIRGKAGERRAQVGLQRLHGCRSIAQRELFLCGEDCKDLAKDPCLVNTLTARANDHMDHYDMT